MVGTIRRANSCYGSSGYINSSKVELLLHFNMRFAFFEVVEQAVFHNVAVAGESRESMVTGHYKNKTKPLFCCLKTSIMTIQIHLHLCNVVHAPTAFIETCLIDMILVESVLSRTVTVPSCIVELQYYYSKYEQNTV